MVLNEPPELVSRKIWYASAPSEALQEIVRFVDVAPLTASPVGVAGALPPFEQPDRTTTMQRAAAPSSVLIFIDLPPNKQFAIRQCC